MKARIFRRSGGRPAGQQNAPWPPTRPQTPQRQFKYLSTDPFPAVLTTGAGRPSQIDSAKKHLATACRNLGYLHFTHHDFRHFFATTCIESGVDIPAVSRWLGHKDGGALAMRVYGHFRQKPSFSVVKRVSF